jgi:hypothetical protein
MTLAVFVGGNNNQINRGFFEKEMINGDVAANAELHVHQVHTRAFVSQT